jgi:hypothetical protein
MPAGMVYIMVMMPADIIGFVVTRQNGEEHKDILVLR